MSSGLLKNENYKLFYKSYVYIYIYKLDLALNTLQGLICQETQPIKSLPDFYCNSNL